MLELDPQGMPIPTNCEEKGMFMLGDTTVLLRE
jgi:hypothetical protein